MQHRLSIQNNCNTRYPRKMFCFRYVIVNTLHEGDNKDDDENGNDNNNNNNNNNERVRAELCRGTRRITQFIMTLVKGI